MRLVILMDVSEGMLGEEIADLAYQKDEFDEVLFLSDIDDEEEPFLVGECEEFEEFADGETVFYPAFSDGQERLQWMERIENAGASVLTLVHGDAYVSPLAAVETGSIIFPYASVGTGAYIGRGSIIGMNAVVPAGCELKRGSTVLVR